MPNCSYTYYLFNYNDPQNPKAIPVSSLKLDEIIQEKYPNINKNELTPDRVAILFNMLFDNNRELLEAIIDRYHDFKPNSKLSTDDYDYVTFMLNGARAEDYGMLKYSYSKKNPLYTQERMSPIIYKSDLSNINMVKPIDPVKFTYPRQLLIHIVESKHDTVKETEFNKSLEAKVKEILDLKYDVAYDNVNNDNNTYTPGNDKFTLLTLLNCALLQRRYKPDSSIYYNLLSIIVLHERIRTIAEEKGLKYDIDAQMVGSNPLRINDFIKLNFMSLDDYRDELDRYQTLKSMEEAEARILSYDEIANQILSEYNFEYNTYITRSDLENNPKEYEEIIDAINKTLEFYKSKGSQRK